MSNSIELLPEFQNLPDDVKTVVSGFKYDDALKAVHVKYKLHIDQASTLEQEIAKIIFGETKSQALISRLQSELRIPAEQAREMAFEINTNLLMPIQNALKDLHNKNV